MAQKKTILDVIHETSCPIIERIINNVDTYSFLTTKKNFTLDTKTFSSVDKFLFDLVSLVKAKNVEYKDDVTLSWTDKLGIALMSFGVAHIIGYAMLVKSTKEQVSSESFILKEDFDVTLVISRLIQKATSNVHKFIKFPNLLGFGMLSIFATGIVFLDAGVALLQRNEAFKDTLPKTYEQVRQTLVKCLNDAVNRSKQIDSTIGSFLAKTFDAVRFVFSKIKALINGIINLFRRNKQESYIIQEGFTDSVLGKIFIRLLKLTGVATIICTAIVVLARMSGISRQTIIEKAGPLKGFFRQVFEIYDTKVDPLINKVFSKSGEQTKEGAEEQQGAEQ